MGVPDMDEANYTDSQLVSRLRNALEAVIQGDCGFYNQLVAVMHRKEEVALIVTSLKAVAGAVSCIHIVHHRLLLAAILGMSLWDCKTDVMDALLEVIVSLASSNGDYVDLCLDMLVMNFMPLRVSYAAQPWDLSKKTQVLDRVHSAIKDISNVVPLSPRRLEKIVKDRMPNIYTKEPIMALYVENMLRLESGAMGELLRSTVLVALMDRLVELDVEIAWEDIMQDDFHKGIFDMELEDFEGSRDHNEQDGNQLTREALIQRFFGGNLVAEKLDSLMVLTFEHLKSCFECGRLVQVYEILLQSFKKTVLPAYKSKFAQFVMFYACSLDPENCGQMLANTLIDIFVGGGVNTERRMSAVAYLASYLARSKCIPASFVASILERVVNWCFDYCKNQDGDINPKAHKIFYAGCQATMYVLCFRMKQILAVPRLNSQLQLMHIDDILKHPLKPLQVCMPSIVEEFCRLAKANDIFSLPETLDDHGLLKSEHSCVFEKLDIFFPFDPCLLRKCDRFIEPYYVYWSMVRSSYEEDDEEGSIDDDIVEAEYENDPMTIPDDRSDEGEDSYSDNFNTCLDEMSITPRDSSHKFWDVMPAKMRP